MNIKAISDLIPKLILNSMDLIMIHANFQTSNDSENFISIKKNQNEFDQMRNEIIKGLFLKLNLENDIETTNNIVNVCIELMENKLLLEYISNDEIILGSLFKSLSLNINEKENRNYSSYNYKEILVLVLNLIRFSLIEGLNLPNLIESNEDIVNFNSSLDQNKIKNTPLGKFIIENISHILQNFSLEKEIENKNKNEDEDEIEYSNETTYGKKAKTLGYQR
jgi:hypothetical protein